MDPVSLKAVQRLAFLLAVATPVNGCGRKPTDAGGAGSMADTATSPDGIRIAYETQGEGTSALVFVHGWSCDRSYWQGQLQPFSRQYKVLAVDLAGHRESGLGRKTQTMAAFGGDVGALESAIGFGNEMPRALQELKLPIVAINPDNKPTDVASMERHGVRVVLMPGVGHFLMMEDPERFNGLLRTVIDTLVR